MGTVFGGAALVTLVLVVGVAGAFLWALSRSALDNVPRALGIAQRVAWVVAAATAAAALFGLVSDLISPAVTMTVPLRLPLPLHIPQLTTEGSPARIESSGLVLAELSLGHIALPTRALWAFGQALITLMPTSLSVLVAVACSRLRDGRPFSTVLTRLAKLAAAFVLLAGFLGQALRGVAGSMASYQALSYSSAAWTGYPEDFDLADVLPEPTVFVPLDFWPLGAAIGLLILTALLARGTHLQNDTEGLV